MNNQSEVFQTHYGIGLFAQSLGGGFIAIGLLGMISFLSNASSISAILFAIMAPLPFISIGAGLMFFRKGVVIDRFDGTITTWWGFLSPLSSKEYQLFDFQYIMISKLWGQVVQEYYYLWLSGQSGSVKILSYGSIRKASKHAKEISKFLNMTIYDKTSKDLVVICPHCQKTTMYDYHNELWYCNYCDEHIDDMDES